MSRSLRCCHDQPASSIGARLAQKSALTLAYGTALEVTSIGLSKASGQDPLLGHLVSQLRNRAP